MRILSATLLAACAVEPQTESAAPSPIQIVDEGVDWDASLPDGAPLPPPGVLSISAVSTLTVGSWLTVDVDGGVFGNSVKLIAGTIPGVGPCPAALGGLCVDIADAVLLKGPPASFDAYGSATVDVMVPAWAEGSSVFFQALEPNGALSSSSPLMELVVGAPAACARIDWKFGSDDWSCPAGYRNPSAYEGDAVTPCITPDDAAYFDYYHDVAFHTGGCNCKWNPAWCGQPSINTIWGGKMCGDFDQLQICVIDS